MRWRHLNVYAIPSVYFIRDLYFIRENDVTARDCTVYIARNAWDSSTQTTIVGYGPGPPPWLSALSVSRSQVLSYGAFVWASRSFSSQKRWFQSAGMKNDAGICTPRATRWTRSAETAAATLGGGGARGSGHCTARLPRWGQPWAVKPFSRAAVYFVWMITNGIYWGT